MRDIKIKPALNGYICICGCQTLVFTDREFMLKEIGRYLTDAAAIEKEYISNAVNKMDGLPILAAAETAEDVPSGNGLLARGVAHRSFGVNERT